MIVQSSTIFQVGWEVFLKEYQKLINSGMNHDQAIEFLKNKYGKKE
jgi:hypothetical protein